MPSSSPRNRVPRVVVSLLLVASPGLAWTPATQVTLAREAAELAPPDLARQIEKHSEELRAGALMPYQIHPPEDHYWHADGAGNLDSVTFREVAATIEAIRQHRPFGEIVQHLGSVAHWVADANNPLAAADGDSAEGRYFADYLRYGERASPRFARVLYTSEPAVANDREMRLMLYRSLHRGRELYPLVGAEYRRIGFASGIDRFDDRSTAFGVAAVAFNHALSDIARVFRYIWVEAGGADGRDEMWAHGGLLVLPRSIRTGAR